MAKSLRVLAEYVTLKVKDVAGSDVIMGYFKGAVVSDVEDKSAQHHIDSGLAEEYEAPAEEATADVDDGGGSDGDQDNGDGAPRGNASRENWAAFATSKGAPAEETKPVEEGGLRQAELRDKYGK